MHSNFTLQPQNSFPDVIVWMLCDNKRVAVKRIPACEVLYSNQPKESSGKRCGRIQVINLEVYNNNNTVNSLESESTARG